jgi:hypothetical protein
MLPKGAQFANDGDSPGILVVTNRTGGALAQYGVYKRDFDQTDAASTDAQKGIHNIVNPTTANDYAGSVVYAESRAVADNDLCQVVVQGPTKAKIESAATAGGLLKIGSANGYTASTGSELVHAVALSTSTASQAAGDVYVFGEAKYLVAP